MATIRKSHNRQSNSISTRVLESLINTPGLSDNEICRRIGVDVQKGTQCRYKLYRDGLLSAAQEVESILSHPFNFLLGSNE